MGILGKIASLFIKDKKIQMDVMLMFYLELSGTDYLHWGLWSPNVDLTRDNFQQAQENYIHHLLSFIPKGVKRILDVGCGVGGNAIKLQERGYEITGLSPDPYQGQLFLERTKGEIPFILSTFEDYEPKERFDLLLMSESVQYIPLGEAFKKAKEVLIEGGYILSSDYFRLPQSRSLRKEQHLPSFYLHDYLEQAEENGFQFLQREEITKEVLPTLYYGEQIFSSYIKPTFLLQLRALKVHLPLLYGLFMGLLKIKIKGEPLKTIIKGNLIPLSPELFQEYMEYWIFLLKRDPNSLS